jgi:hypothetical protein
MGWNQKVVINIICHLEKEVQTGTNERYGKEGTRKLASLAGFNGHGTAWSRSWPQPHGPWHSDNYNADIDDILDPKST